MTDIAANKAGSEVVMINQSRETKVLVVLGISITLGAIILNALGHNPPSAGAFCLSSYYRLGRVEESILSRAAQSPGRWNRVEIYYSGTESDNIEQLDSLSNTAGPEYIKCHFVICDGRIGRNGQIQPTEKWQRQSSVNVAENWDFKPVSESASSDLSKYDRPTNLCKTPTHHNENTIYICVIADGKTSPPTDSQIKRTEALVEGLCRKFKIQPEAIHYPDDWH
jgi:hypothetical protein